MTQRGAGYYVEKQAPFKERLIVVLIFVACETVTLSSNREILETFRPER